MGNNICRSQRRRHPGGFTLVELLLVLIILAVLAGVIVPKFTNRSEDARKTAAKTDIHTIEMAMDTYEVDNGKYPSNEDGGLAALETQPAGATNWKGPYIKIKPDPWGHPYVYTYPGQHNANGADIYSLGPDGREGNDDIGNW